MPSPSLTIAAPDLPVAPRRLAEVVEPHTQLLRVTLEADNARAYWRRSTGGASSVDEETHAAFEQFWFGSKSMTRVRRLVLAFRHRYAAYPPALRALTTLEKLSAIDRETAVLIAHWHLQIADPIYRRFAGEFLPRRRAGIRGEVTRRTVVDWVSEQDAGDRWNSATRIGFASKLLSAAHAAGLVASTRDPRALVTPRIPQQALVYLLYVLREIEFRGSIQENPYLRSVGVEGHGLDDRLRGAHSLVLRRQGDLAEITWRDDTLMTWAARALPSEESSR